MNTVQFEPFERAPKLQADKRTAESLGALIAKIGQSGTPNPKVSEYRDYWKRFIATDGDPRLQRESSHIDRQLIIPYRRQGSIAIKGSLSLVDEVITPLADSRTPIAVAEWDAELYDNNDPNSNYRAIVWGTYEISRAATSAENNGGIGVSISLAMGPPTEEPCALPDSVMELWDMMRLPTLMEYPTDLPFQPVHLDGRSEHLRALTQLASEQEPEAPKAT